MQTREFRIAENRFHGILYPPEQNEYADKVLILFGGSDGNFQSTRKLVEMFSTKGITVMALAYWNVLFLSIVD
jgi:hypothetical protein